MELNTQIKKHRTSLNLSQKELAEKVYVTWQTISNWENDKIYERWRTAHLLPATYIGTFYL